MGERETNLYTPEVERITPEDVPDAEDLEGQASLLFWAAPQPSNWRIFINRLAGPELESNYDDMLRALRSPNLSKTVETGVLRRYVKADMDRKQKEGKFTPDQKTLEEYMWRLVNETGEEERAQMAEEAGNLLEEIAKALKPQPGEKSGNDLSGLTRGVNLKDLGGSEEDLAIKRSIAKLFESQAGSATKVLLELASDTRAALLLQQLAILLDQLSLGQVNGGMKRIVRTKDGNVEIQTVPKTSWAEVDDATKAFIEQKWRNEVWAVDEYGTSVREMTLRVLAERKGAPAGTHLGWERPVYEALVDRIQPLHERIADMRRIREPEGKIKELEDEIEKVGAEMIAPHVTSYTGTVAGRMEYGPVGTTQVDEAGFKEARIFNQLHRGIIIPDTTPYPPSWESMARRTEINTCVVIAQMALDELNYLESLPPRPRGRRAVDTVPPEDRELREQIDAHNAASPVSLREKLQAYIRQPTHERDFYQVFPSNPKQIEEVEGPLGKEKKVTRGELTLISQLTGVPLSINPRNQAIRFDPRIVEIGRDSTRSRRALINVWKVESQVGRLSPGIVKQMFDRPEKYPGRTNPDDPQLTELKAILDDPSREMVASVCGFPVDGSMGGGTRQEGRSIDEKSIVEQKRQESWTNRDWYAHWLDEIQRQRETGIYPERMLLTQSVVMVEQYLLRREHFSPDKNISFVVTEVPSEDSANFGTPLKYMHAGGIPINSMGFKAHPIAQTLEQPGEFGCMIIHDKDSPVSTELEVRFRDKVLTERGEATPSFIEFFKRAILNELNLSKSHAKLGGPMVSVPRETPSHEDIGRYGAFLVAYNNYLDKQIAELEERATASADPTEVLKSLLDFYRDRLQYITYNVFDSVADPITENAIPDPEFKDLIREHKNELARIRGSILKKDRDNYTLTLMNVESTRADIERAREEYLHHANEYVDVLLEEELLGMKATGQLPQGKEADRRIAELAASIYVDAIIKQFVDVGLRCWKIAHEKNTPIQSYVNKLFRNIVGSVSETALIQYCEAVAYKYDLDLGELGDRRKIPDSVLEYLEENKKHAELVFYIAAQMATAVNIGRTSEEITAGGREILQKLLDVFRRAGIKEGADTTDRLTDADWLHHMHTVEKERGIPATELITRLLDETTLRDIDEVDAIVDQWRPTVPDDERTTFRNLLRRLLLSYEGMLEQSGWRNEPGIGNIRTLLPRIGSRRGRAINRDQSRNIPPYGRDIADRH